MTPRLLLPAILAFMTWNSPAAMEFIRVSKDGSGFVETGTGKTFQPFGVNYDHDGPGRLLEEYWWPEWATVVEDFREMKALGFNCVRIHLQFGIFMDAPDQPNPRALHQWSRLVRLAEETGLYLDVTGLACYHKQHIPDWYDTMDESSRWKAQAVFWKAIASVAAESPAIFCYDLMNEPILPGKKGETEWLAGELEGKFFVQRISRDLAGRTREEVAAAWIRDLTGAIREVDSRHLVTVGVIPWALVFPGAKPLFHDPEVGKPLDFASVHFYPEKDQIPKALEALKAYRVGKPLVVEEFFPLKCSREEAGQFMEEARGIANGWISFYWGTTIQEYREVGDLKSSLIAGWLEYFSKRPGH